MKARTHQKGKHVTIWLSKLSPQESEGVISNRLKDAWLKSLWYYFRSKRNTL